MALKVAFIFVAPEYDPALHRSAIKTPVVELCAGFSNEGVAAITKADEGKAVFGVVRFDLHPGFDHRSSDEFFQ